MSGRKEAQVLLNSDGVPMVGCLPRFEATMGRLSMTVVNMHTEDRGAEGIEGVGEDEEEGAR